MRCLSSTLIAWRERVTTPIIVVEHLYCNLILQRVSSGPVLVRECSSASVFSHRVTASPTSLLHSSQSSSGGSLGSTLDCNLVVVDVPTKFGLQDDDPFSCAPCVPSPQPELDTDDGAEETRVKLLIHRYDKSRSGQEC